MTFSSSVKRVVLYTAKVRFFKQITTGVPFFCPTTALFCIPQRYDFSSKSQHTQMITSLLRVVLYTAKVRFFKQITTNELITSQILELFCIPQRYDFSSKSQLNLKQSATISCFVYRKGTIFQANHNSSKTYPTKVVVVLYTAKVRFFKQITTNTSCQITIIKLFCIPQRYDFSSKSQLNKLNYTDLQVVLYTAKVRFFKQITTP